MRFALRCETPEVQVKFELAADSSLAAAHKLWELVSAHQRGGDAELSNPDCLSNKEEALRCVMSKLERLRRWERHLDRKRGKVMEQVSTLNEVIDVGGPGARPGYQPHRCTGLSADIDIDQVRLLSGTVLGCVAVPFGAGTYGFGLRWESTGLGLQFVHDFGLRWGCAI